MITESKLMSRILQTVDRVKSLFNTMEIFRGVMLTNNVWVISATMLIAMLSLVISHRK